VDAADCTACLPVSCRTNNADRDRIDLSSSDWETVGSRIPPSTTHSTHRPPTTWWSISSFFVATRTGLCRTRNGLLLGLLSVVLFSVETHTYTHVYIYIYIYYIYMHTHLFVNSVGGCKYFVYGLMDLFINNCIEATSRFVYLCVCPLFVKQRCEKGRYSWLGYT